MTSQALVLDFGGVISRTLFETHALSEQALGLPPGTLRWRGPFDPASDPLWQDMQADRITAPAKWAPCWASTGTAWKPLCSAPAGPTCRP